MIPNAAMRQAYERVYEQFHFDYNFMGMEALIAAYDACEDFVEQQNRYFTENLSVVRDFLRCEMPELRLIEPEGTYLLWLDCRAWGLKQPELMARFAGWGVGLNDGSMYGPGGEGFVRMNIATRRAVLAEALGRIKTGYAEWKKNGGADAARQ